MRHNCSGRKLNRTASHRKATLSALCTAVIKHKRIHTTTAKAKETRMVVEKIITRAKNAVARETDGQPKDVHARREVFAYLRDRDAVTELFAEVAPKVATRAGGYTRVVKLGRRAGDGAEVALLELVDFNTGQDKAAAKTVKKAVQPRRKKGGAKAGAKAPAAGQAAATEAAAPAAEQK
jgi:large subunit ribosomal protein L17